MKEKLVINDAVYGNIEIEGIFKELVESDDFQRLKDIKQTGTSTIEYPSMEEETRYDHSIGSYYLMCKIIDNIEKKLSKYRIEINKEEKEIVKIAMLLHDIGHGAYSHTLEKIAGYSHEKRSIDIVADEITQINQIISKYYGEDFTKKVADFLEFVYEHKKENRPLRDIKVQENQVDLKELLASLISNNIDADRLDYLIRDSKYAGFKVLTEPQKLIDSFEFILDTNKMIVAIPQNDIYLAETAFFERTRNYDKIYYCDSSIIGDHVLDFLLNQLQNNKEEVTKNKAIESPIQKLLTNKETSFSTYEYMRLTDTPVNGAIQVVGENTKNELIKYLSDTKQATKDFQTLNTNKSEKYIRYLLKKAIPELQENTMGLVDETRIIKPYKSNDRDVTNVITADGIEKYEDINHYINTESIKRRVIAINPELIRLELGISKTEFDEKYAKILQEIISTVTKPKDEFELKYIITKAGIEGQEIKEKLEEKYKILDEAKYGSHDIYYENKDNYKFLENRETLRIREGTTFHKSKETYQFKRRRISHKSYKNSSEANYIIRRKEEEIGESIDLEDYKEFTQLNGIDTQNAEAMLDVDNLRYLYTINVNGVLIDISFNLAYYKNEIYETFGNIGTIEIRPRDNQVKDRITLLQLQDFIENEFPKLKRCISTTNVYEVGMVDTYEKYRKGYIVNEDAQEYEEKNKEATKKLDTIINEMKKKKDFAFTTAIPSVEEIIRQNKMQEEPVL